MHWNLAQIERPSKRENKQEDLRRWVATWKREVFLWSDFKNMVSSYGQWVEQDASQAENPWTTADFRGTDVAKLGCFVAGLRAATRAEWRVVVWWFGGCGQTSGNSCVYQ